MDSEEAHKQLEYIIAINNSLIALIESININTEKNSELTREQMLFKLNEIHNITSAVVAANKGDKDG